MIFTKTGFFFNGVLLPLLSGVFCFWLGYQMVNQSGLGASAPVLVVLLLGIPLVILARRGSTSAFFAQRPIAYDSIA